MKTLTTGLLVCAMVLIAAPAMSQTKGELQTLSKNVDELKALIAGLQATISLQQKRLAELESTKPVAVNSQPASSNRPAETAAVASTGSYLPEIGLVADIVGTISGSTEDAEGNDRISARDVELVIGHDVDPYSRLDATIVFSDGEEPALEEAYASFWDLPLDSKLRLGRLKPKIGKAAATHRDALDTVDVPLVIQRYLGAEGLSRSGADLTFFTPLASDQFTQELTLGVLEGGGGEEGQLLGDVRRIPTVYSKLKNSFDLSDVTSAELGATWLNGSADKDSGREVNTVALDATLTHSFDTRHKFKFQNEAFINHDSTTWGYYSLVDYRASERWGLGSRWDWLEPIVHDESTTNEHEQALGGYLTYFQSEFARWRLQYQHSWDVKDDSDDRLMLQGTFAIGTHKHALQ